LWATPIGILAILGGWVTAETGRQPWVVFGQLRTSDAASQLAPGELLFSVLGFILLYLVLLGTYIGYIVHTMRVGPELDHPDRSEPSGGRIPVFSGMSSEPVGRR
jgi:cytochrome d ubiquinol oxidase subunit I